MSNKVTLNQLIEELSDEAIIPKVRSQEFINAFLENALSEINDKGKSAITNFGSFTVVEVAERIGVNPKSGEPLVIPAHKRISFTPYKALEKRVNREYDHLEAEVVEPTIPNSGKSDGKNDKTEAERLFDALTGGMEEQFDQPIKQTDPFDFDEEEIPSREIELEESSENEEVEIPEVEEEITPEPEVELAPETEEPEEVFGFDEGEDEDSEETEMFEELQDDEDDEVPVRAFKTPGRPERKSNGVSPTMLLAILGIFIIAIVGIWYFFIRTESAPQTASTPNETQNILNDPSAFENAQVLNEVNDASQESIPVETEDTESRVIPLAAPEVDITENQGEVMTIENQEPQIEYERFTGISYSVSSGVWIYEIARQTYGNTRLWPLIFQANYTLTNNPDLILPNIELNIPQLEGSADSPTANDYIRLAEAARYVARAYANAGNSAQSAAYIKAADWYETMQ